MTIRTDSEPGSWKTFVVLAAIVAPVFAVLWLGITLCDANESVPTAVVKIVFTIIAVGTGVSGVKWATAAGAALLIESLAVILWIVLKAATYPPFGALRTALLLAVPLAVSGATFILADGIKAGTWPPARFRSLSRE